MPLALSLIALSLATMDATLANPGFENGLEGWEAKGSAHVSTDTPIAGKASLVFGPHPGSVRQRYAVSGLRILYFGAKLDAESPDVKAQLRLECFDPRGRRLMNLTAGPDAKKAAAIYLKTHAFTASVVVSIETRGKGRAKADEVVLQDDDRNRIEHEPKVDLDEATRPFWEGDRVADESVLLLSTKGAPASGRLLFPPTKIVSLHDAHGTKTYLEGKDFRVDGQTIVALSGSAIPTMSDTEFATGEYPWTRLDGRHVFVTYDHASHWTGPIPPSAGDLLPATRAKLRAKRPLTVVAYGDSITLGINVSGFLNVPPYLPPWPSLAVHRLAKQYGTNGIKLYNAALGGMTSQWARDNAKDVVASLKPDLVFVAFGMNDFWSLTPELFRKNMEATLNAIRATRPGCEFVLIAPMKFDPAYTTEATYVNNLAGYADELRKLQGPGVAVLDMTALTDALYRAKSAKDLTTDPMHPDDFLGRVYAQAMAAVLSK